MPHQFSPRRAAASAKLSVASTSMPSSAARATLLAGRCGLSLRHRRRRHRRISERERPSAVGPPPPAEALTQPHAVCTTEGAGSFPARRAARALPWAVAVIPAVSTSPMRSKMDGAAPPACRPPPLLGTSSSSALLHAVSIRSAIWLAQRGSSAFSRARQSAHSSSDPITRSAPTRCCTVPTRTGGRRSTRRRQHSVRLPRPPRPLRQRGLGHPSVHDGSSHCAARWLISVARTRSSDGQGRVGLPLSASSFTPDGVAHPTMVRQRAALPRGPLDASPPVDAPSTRRPPGMPPERAPGRAPGRALSRPGRHSSRSR